jgi:hypothetical protein
LTLDRAISPVSERRLQRIATESPCIWHDLAGSKINLIALDSYHAIELREIVSLLGDASFYQEDRIPVNR